MAESEPCHEPSRLYMADVLSKTPLRGTFLAVLANRPAIYKRDSGAAREEVAVIAETIAIFRDSFSYNRNYRDFE